MIEGKKLVVVCPEQCSLRPDKIGDHVTNVLIAMRENGGGSPAMSRRATELLKRRVPPTNMQRHLAHFKELADDDPIKAGGPRPTDLHILDSIIVAGFRNSRNWKPSIKDTLDAMKLKTQMTGQSAFEDMLTAMDAALDFAEDEEASLENPEAVSSPDERTEVSGD